MLSLKKKKKLSQYCSEYVFHQKYSADSIHAAVLHKMQNVPIDSGFEK